MAGWRRKLKIFLFKLFHLSVFPTGKTINTKFWWRGKNMNFLVATKIMGVAQMKQITK